MVYTDFKVDETGVDSTISNLTNIIREAGKESVPVEKSKAIAKKPKLKMVFARLSCSEQ